MFTDMPVAYFCSLKKSVFFSWIHDVDSNINSYGDKFSTVYLNLELCT